MGYCTSDTYAHSYLLVGQIDYHSRITERIEKIPVAVSLMGAPGTDLDLIEWTLQALKKGGRPTKVKAGKLAF